MKRAWFQAEDRTYYRNLPLIMDERQRCILFPWRWRRFSALGAEWDQAWTEGVIRKPHLGRGDVLVMPLSFRVTYPDLPGLWVLDGTP